MPLSPASQREPAHTRVVTCRGFRRADGLWDIEGHLCDTKSKDIEDYGRGRLPAGEPVHEMWIRMTVDGSLTIRAIEAVTDAGPYPVCPAIAVNFQRLVGLTVGPGWRRKVHERVGGVQGCTHLVELLSPVATTAYQTIYSGEPSEEELSPGQRPPLLNSCHAFDEKGALAARFWPSFHRP